MTITREVWHDGIGYEVDALSEVTGVEMRAGSFGDGGALRGDACFHCDEADRAKVSWELWEKVEVTLEE